MSHKLNVAIITGGRSSERDISLVTAGRVRENLDPAKYDSRIIDSADAAELFSLIDHRPDVAFIAQHGKGGEDGAIQGFLETFGIRYTGSGLLASALAMDKLRTKEFLAARGVQTPWSLAVQRERSYSIPEDIAAPVIVKPNSVGSSDGLTVVRDRAHLIGAIEYALTFDRTILVEQFIAGMEITGAVLGNGDNLESLPLIEIIPHKGVYDREAKYTPGATDEICPARLSPEVTARARQVALDCHAFLDCRGMSRTDMLVTPEGEVYMIEVNTIPGMTQTSLLPCAALQAGYSFSQLLDRLIDLALEENSSK